MVPTYDEADNVAPLARRILAAVPGAEVLFVDDASPDGTARRIGELAGRDWRIRLLPRPRKLGLGTAYLEGFRVGLRERFDVVATMDADLSHDPGHLPALIAASAEHDLVLGSRYVPGGGVRNWGLHRRLLSRCANAVARRLLDLPVRDGTTGFRVYRAQALRVLPLEGIRSSGYSFLEEITVLAVRRGLSLAEVPIVFCDREGGRSKISGLEIWRAAWRVVGLWIDGRGEGVASPAPTPVPASGDPVAGAGEVGPYALPERNSPPA
ncbi:MAG: polyprenol monophosphomannose synthase [Thermoanaerobaculia bacterium]